MIIPVFIPHLGCPHTCIFCNQRTISGQAETGLAAARAQIEQYLHYSKGQTSNQIAFYGGSFTALPLDYQQQLLEIAQEYIQAGQAGSVRLSTRPDAITPTIVAQLQKYQVETVELGVQSLDEKVLRLAERGHGVACVYSAVELLRQAKLQVGLQLMVGLPGQDRESLADTKEQVCYLAPDIVRIYPVLVIKGTRLSQMYQEGNYVPLSLEEAVAASYELYEQFTRYGIQVIRMGLQADGELCSEGNIVAGPFHPSFGELVFSYGYRQKVNRYIEQLPAGVESIIIEYPPKEEPKLRGMHKSNLRYWQEHYPVKIILRRSTTFALKMV